MERLLCEAIMTRAKPLAPRSVPVSVIVPTKNEEKNLHECLASLRWADEVFVVDSHSTDRTGDIAEQFGAQVVPFDYDGGWPKMKNWAIRNLPFRNDWILIVDADERVPDALACEIAASISRPTAEGYYVRWKFVFLGRWMKWCWRHGWMLRLFRRGHGEYEDLGMRGEGGWDNEVHENVVVDGDTAKLNELLLHESREDVAFWIAKQNQFSTWNALRRVRGMRAPTPLSWLVARDPLKRRKALKRLYLALPLKPLLTFTWLYVARFGFLDGAAGYRFCLLRACHEAITDAKVMEAEQQRSSSREPTSDRVGD
jgi:hypothetical protein